MKLLEGAPDRLVFGLAGREKSFLERLLSFYPLAPEAPATLSRESAAEMADAEALLRESLREQNQELSGWLRLHLTEGEALRRAQQGWRLTLSGSDADRLLQVLNELRVTAWTRLGCPEELGDPALAEVSTNEPFFAIMTLAGQFEMALVHALDDGSDPALPPPEEG